MKKLLGGLVMSCLCWHTAVAQEQNEANNPLNPRPMLSLHNYYVPKFNDLDHSWANQTILRGVLPNRTFGLPQLWRFNLPIVSMHDHRLGHQSGIGDLSLMDIFMRSGERFSFGAGPLLVLPTASNDFLGQGKWQAGVAGAIVAPREWGLVGGLITYQQSFAGDAKRENVKLMTIQPVTFYNLPKGYYLRSSGVWTFDLKKKTHFTPVGLGLGKVMKRGGHKTLNAFIEPQYSVSRKGVGVPTWQVFAGLNFQF